MNNYQSQVNYEQLSVTNRNQNSGEDPSNQDIKISNNRLFDGNKEIQARTLGLDFPKFEGSEPME